MNTRIRRIVTIDGGGGDSLVNNQNPPGPAVTLNSVPRLRSTTPLSGPLGGFEIFKMYGENLGDANGVITGDGTFVPLLSPPVFNTTTQQWELSANIPVPSTAGMMDLMVRTSLGYQSAPVSFSYLVAPVVTSIAPAAGPLSNPGPVAIFGTDLSGATAVNFGQNAGTITAIIQPIRWRIYGKYLPHPRM